MVDIKSLVVLGDSMSDIGNKWTWPTGELGRLVRAMRVNETGRFSDGKNWTDFLVEWATGEALLWGNRDLAIRKSTDHRTLTSYSTLEVNAWGGSLAAKPPVDLDQYLKFRAEEQKRPPSATPARVRYVNYAMGGCIVTTDWAPKFGALTYLRGQVEDYLVQRDLMGSAFGGATLHVIWAGLNDFVTAGRPDYDPKTTPSSDQYGDWAAWAQKDPARLVKGVGAFPAVAEIKSLVELINSRFPTAKDDHHFLVIDLPSVYHAIRYMEGLGEPSKIEEAKRVDPVVRRYDTLLARLVEDWPQTQDAPAPGHVHLVRMSRWMDYVSENLDTWKLSKLAQDRGVRPFYNPGVPPEPKQDPVSADMRRRITTSDLAHPTEAVYALMARYVVARLLSEGYTLGRLSPGTWAENAPFKDLPFDAPSYSL